MASVLEQIRKLDEQKEQLLATAKQEALDAANKAVGELNELGFHYKLVEGGGVAAFIGRIGNNDAKPGRRSGIRDDVLKAVKAFPKITRADLLVKMDVKGDKSGEQSVSNALAALKKAGTIKADDGAYTAA